MSSDVHTAPLPLLSTSKRLRMFCLGYHHAFTAKAWNAMSTVLPSSSMGSGRRVLAPCILLFLTVYLSSVAAFPLDDTHRNGLYEDGSSHYESAVYNALSSSSSSIKPTVREAAMYLSIHQHMEAPELTNPPRMPQCISGSKVSKALTAAINVKYAAQLTMNASVDTTYIQTLRKCDYNSFINLSGPEEVRKELVDAANANKLCDLLPTYCIALNLQPAPSPTTTAAKTAATAAGHSLHTSTPSSSSSSSSGSSDTMGRAAATPTASAAAQPIDNMRRRGIQRRTHISSIDPYILLSSSGTENPDLPPVLGFKCVKHNFTQVLNHFAKGHDQHVDAANRTHDKDSTSADPHALQWDSDSDLWESETVKAATEEQQWKKQETFTQVYWVCDAAWPTDHHAQKQDGNVIVFLGNESPLGIPRQPIVFENARRLNALVILVEHRYYGESLPYSEPKNGRVPTEQYKWLTIQQVIEDTVLVVQHVRQERHIPESVPNIVIGGSYGGMIASYHRVVRPDVFDAAVAASAPIYYIVDTKMWRHTSNRYHQFIEDAANTMSGSTQCSDTVRDALEELLHLGKSSAGRQNITETMRLCGTGDTALPSIEAVLGLQENIIGTFQGLAQVNNQPPVMGEMAIACGVINEATAAGQTPLAAVAALYSYFSHNGSANWCYNFTYDPDTPTVPDASTGYNSYTYQCCTQGSVYSSELPARGSDATLNPEDIPVPVRDIQENCRNVFGKHVPKLHAPGFARHIMPLLHEYGNVVFTNGDLDGWAGGSLGLLPVVDREHNNSSSSSGGSLMFDIGVDFDARNGGLSAHHAHVAFVVYRNASHCTDTHTNTWADPHEPTEWKKQRALAMDYAIGFAKTNKRETVV